MSYEARVARKAPHKILHSGAHQNLGHRNERSGAPTMLRQPSKIPSLVQTKQFYAVLALHHSALCTRDDHNYC
eukprot:1699520-Pleurochrysis_carterae.AAC.2